MTPLPGTGIPPHTYFTADKATMHRSTNQAIMMCIMHRGKLIAIPVGSPLVYRTSDESDANAVELEGGSGEDLANNLVDPVLAKVELPEDHLSYILG